MSDDVITSFLQSQPVTNDGVKGGGEKNIGSQDTDFNRVFLKEEKKLSNDALDQKKKVAEGEDGSPTNKKGEEAIRGQNEHSEADRAGSELPDLSVHNGALAVGRIIYTSKDIAVTSESLSKFMVRQGLVSNGLKKGTILSPDITGEQTANDKGSSQGLPHGQKIDGLNSFGQELISRFKLESDKDSPLKNLEGQHGKKGVNPQENSLRLGSGSAGQESTIKADVFSRRASGHFDGEVSPEADRFKNPQSNQSDIESDLRLKQLNNIIAETKKPAQLGREFKPTGSLGNSAEALTKNMNPLSQFLDGERGRDFTEVKTDPVRDGLQPDGILKNREQIQENLSKNQRVERFEDYFSESKKGQAHGQLHLQRFLGEIKETVKVARSIDNLKSIGSVGYSEPNTKGLRDAGQHSSQEAIVHDLNQSRVEFKGALREAQRLVSTNTYNNLTDSYESWNSRFGEVLANRIAGHMSRENWNVHLKMNPASLGEISLEIDFSEKGLEGRLGANEESTRQLLQDTLPKLRLALREILEENQGLKLDVGDFGNSKNQDGSDKPTAPVVVEELNFESEVLAGNTLDAKLGAVVGLNILV